MSDACQIYGFVWVVEGDAEVPQRVAVRLPEEMTRLRRAEVALNVTNLTDKKGWSTISIGSATNSYSAYPIAPRQWFLTLSRQF